MSKVINTRELDGLTEATHGPSQHACRGGGVIVDTTISQSRLVLVCYNCSTFWLTGLTDDSYITVAAMKRAADDLYQVPAYKRQRHLRDQNRARTEKMVKLYNRGFGCYRIGKIFGCTRQAVWERLSTAGVELRPQYKKLLPKIEFNGASYTFSHSKGYYRRTDGLRTLLHYDVWEYHCGPVPDGHQVIFRDGDKRNVEIANLMCMPIEAVTRMYHPAEPRPAKVCAHCGQQIQPPKKDGGTLGPTAWSARKYCDRQCFAAHKKAERQRMVEAA